MEKQKSKYNFLALFPESYLVGRVPRGMPLKEGAGMTAVSSGSSVSTPEGASGVYGASTRALDRSR